MKTFRALMLTAVLMLSTGAHSQPAGFVTAHGAEILDPAGMPLLLKGINLGNWLVPEGYMFKFDSVTSPRMIKETIAELVGPERAQQFWREYRDAYITRKDIAHIKSLGFNSIRIPFHWELFESEAPFGKDIAAGFIMLDRAISWCREEGLWVVLDMHCAPGGQTGDNIDDSYGYPYLFEEASSREKAVRLWRAIAQRYAAETIVIGYDLLNEPIAHYFDKTALNPLLEPFYKDIVAAIREVDTKHLVILGGAQWDNNFSVFGPPFDAKTVYTFHKYWCDTTQAMVQEYVDFRTKYSVPLWMGESGENTDAWIGAWRRLQERNNIGWCFWPYKKMESDRCAVTFPKPELWTLISRYANSTHRSYGAMRATRPPREKVQKALEEFLRFCRQESCTENHGFIDALGLTPVVERKN